MYKFFIKKNFFDGWDNMINIIISNLVMLGVLSIFIFSAHYVVDYSLSISFLLIALGFIAITIFTFAFGKSAKDIADFKVVPIKSYFKEIPHVIKDAILFSLIIGLLFLLLYVAIPFYVSLSNTVGLLLAALVLWLVIISFLALQWFLPLRSLMGNNFMKCLKKSFMLFFDNPMFSIFLLFYNAVLCLLSIPVFLIVPSFAGITLSSVNAVRLRLNKYDYIENHPELSKKQRKHLPWKEILKDDIEAVGNRSIKSFIFPGKY